MNYEATEATLGVWSFREFTHRYEQMQEVYVAWCDDPSVDLSMLDVHPWSCSQEGWNAATERQWRLDEMQSQLADKEQEIDAVRQERAQALDRAREQNDMEITVAKRGFDVEQRELLERTRMERDMEVAEAKRERDVAQ